MYRSDADSSFAVVYFVAMKAITFEMLRQEIKSYGPNKLAKEVLYPRQVLQAIAAGRRKPSSRLLARLGMEAVTVYRMIETKGDDRGTP